MTAGAVAEDNRGDVFVEGQLAARTGHVGFLGRRFAGAPPRQHTENRGQDEETQDQGTQDFRADHAHERRPRQGPQERQRERDARRPPVHEAGTGVADGRGERAEERLPLVGPEREMRREPHREERRDHDQSSAPADGVHGPGEERGQDQRSELERGNGRHGGKQAHRLEDSP